MALPARVRRAASRSRLRALERKSTPRDVLHGRPSGRRRRRSDRCSRWRPPPGTCSWRTCGTATRTPCGARPTSCARRSVGFDLAHSARGAVDGAATSAWMQPHDPRFMATVPGQGYRFVPHLLEPGVGRRAEPGRTTASLSVARDTAGRRRDLEHERVMVSSSGAAGRLVHAQQICARVRRSSVPGRRLTARRPAPGVPCPAARRRGRRRPWEGAPSGWPVAWSSGTASTPNSARRRLQRLARSRSHRGIAFTVRAAPRSSPTRAPTMRLSGHLGHADEPRTPRR